MSGFCVYCMSGFCNGLTMPRPKTLRDKIAARIARRNGEDVFLTREFADLGGEDQVLRALRSLMHDGRLVRLGYGAMAAPSGRAFPASRCFKVRMVSSARRAKLSTSSESNGNRPRPSGPTTNDDPRKCLSI